MWDVDALGGDVGRNQDLSVGGEEFSQYLLPVLLKHLATETFRLVLQIDLLFYVPTLVPRITENDDGAALSILVQQSDQCAGLPEGRASQHDMLDVVVCFARAVFCEVNVDEIGPQILLDVSHTPAVE